MQYGLIWILYNTYWYISGGNGVGKEHAKHATPSPNFFDAFQRFYDLLTFMTGNFQLKIQVYEKFKLRYGPPQNGVNTLPGKQ